MFINNDRSILSTASRNTKLISLDEFKKRIVDRIFKLDEKLRDEVDDVERPDTYSDEIALVLIEEDSNVQKDLKFIFDTENLTTDPTLVFGGFPEINNLLGFNITPFGMPYLGIQAGGDWEFPLFFIIYFDGKKFRAYMPSYGNTVNLDCKTAFGSEDSSKSFNTIAQKYISQGLLSPDADYTSSDLTDIYLNKQGFNQDTLMGDWNAILEDISHRFSVIA